MKQNQFIDSPHQHQPLSQVIFQTTNFLTQKIFPQPNEWMTKSQKFNRIILICDLAAAPAPAQVLAVENKFIGEGKSQYHSQNELGEATYGHREPNQAHDAVQDAHGNKAGSFSYVAPDGRLLTTEYIADAAGYRVASNALPNAPNAAIPAAITPTIAAAEKPIESGDSIVVEVRHANSFSFSNFI